MSKINNECSRAFWANRYYKNSNTEVVPDTGDITFLYLFGNKIAWHMGNELWITLAGYPTKTTRERLNAILPDGFCIQKCQGKTRLFRKGGYSVQEISDTEVIKVL